MLSVEIALKNNHYYYYYLQTLCFAFLYKSLKFASLLFLNDMGNDMACEQVKVSKLVHTANCKFYIERIALASSSKELHKIVNTLSNRHQPKILPTI